MAFCLAILTTPVGVSGAVFLVPFQISVVHTPSPAVTPTNLLFNLIAIPGALFRFHHERRLGGSLMRLLILGTLPGVIAGAVIRVFVLDEGSAFLLVVAAVLVPLGAWLAFAPPPAPAASRFPPPPPDRPSSPGGGDGRRHLQIGGGSILGPILVGLGFTVVEVAPAALAAPSSPPLPGS